MNFEEVLRFSMRSWRPFTRGSISAAKKVMRSWQNGRKRNSSDRALNCYADAHKMRRTCVLAPASLAKLHRDAMLDKSEVPACEVISPEMLRAAVRAYYSNGRYESFLKQMPHMDTTEQTKRYMELMK